MLKYAVDRNKNLKIFLKNCLKIELLDGSYKTLKLNEKNETKCFTVLEMK